MGREREKKPRRRKKKREREGGSRGLENKEQVPRTMVKSDVKKSYFRGCGDSMFRKT